MPLDEKNEQVIEHVERRSSSTEPTHDLLLDGELLAQDVRLAAERRLVRLLDFRLLPTIIVIFLMNYIDVSVVRCTLIGIASSSLTLHLSVARCGYGCEIERAGTRSWAQR